MFKKPSTASIFISIVVVALMYITGDKSYFAVAHIWLAATLIIMALEDLKNDTN